MTALNAKNLTLSDADFLKDTIYSIINQQLKSYRAGINTINPASDHKLKSLSVKHSGK